MCFKKFVFFSVENLVVQQIPRTQVSIFLCKILSIEAYRFSGLGDQMRFPLRPVSETLTVYKSQEVLSLTWWN